MARPFTTWTGQFGSVTYNSASPNTITLCMYATANAWIFHGGNVQCGRCNWAVSRPRERWALRALRRHYRRAHQPQPIDGRQA